MRRLRISLVVVGLLGLVACSTLPAGYESLQDEARLLEVSKYFLAVRTAYVSARQSNLLPANEFVLAVKADETLRVAWDRLLAAKRVEADSFQMWVSVLESLNSLEAILRVWLPADTFQRPSVLTPQP